MAILLDRVLERKALRIVCANNTASSYLLGVLRPEDFANSANLEAFNRIKNITSSRLEVPTWHDILHDPVLSEQTRDALKLFKEKIRPNRAIARGVYNNLQKLRRLRVLYQGVKSASDLMLKDSVDEEKITDLLYNTATESRFKSNSITTFNFGESNNSTDLVKEILTGKGLVFIPTGFKAYDGQNKGFLLGSLVIIGAPTSGGKSKLLLNLIDNLADQGATCAYVSLEMSETELGARFLSKQSKVPLTKILSAEQLSPKEKQKIISAYKKRVTALKAKGAVVSLKIPQEDLNIEEVLFQLKPFGYSVIAIDYLTLLKGVDGEDQWRKLNSVARYCKVFAKNNNAIIILLCQVNDEGYLRFSKAVLDHASTAWIWLRDERSKSNNILHITQPKARMGRSFEFDLLDDTDTMTIRDIDNSTKKKLEEWTRAHSNTRGRGRPRAKTNGKAKNYNSNYDNPRSNGQAGAIRMSQEEEEEFFSVQD